MKRIDTNEKTGYGINPKGIFGRAAVLFMLAAAAATLISSWGMWEDKTYVAMMVLLPVGCNILFALCVLLLGKKGFFLSVIPMLFAVVYCIFEATYIENIWAVVVSTVLCAALLLLYAATVWGVIRSKWLLPPVLAGALAALITINIPKLADKVNPVSFSEGMRTIAVLCSVAGLLCISLGLRRNRREAKPEEPTIIAEPENVLTAETETAVNAAQPQSDTPEPEQAPTEHAAEIVPQEQTENKEEQPRETVNEKQ